MNIAVRMLEDAYDDRFDTAIVVSGDSDLTAPIQAVRRLLPRQTRASCLPAQALLQGTRAVADHAFGIFARNHPCKPSTTDHRQHLRDHLTAPQGWLPATHDCA